MTVLPSNAHVVAGDDVWMESAGIEQLARVAGLDGCVRAVGMPDLHPGRGIPIGAAFLFADRVLPDLVGADAGCGVLLVVGHRDGPRGDALERRVRAALDTPVLPDVDPDALLEAVLRDGPRGLATLDGVPDALAELVRRAPADEGPSAALPDIPNAAEQLGTIGGGNHFAEISRVDRIFDKTRARALGIRTDAQAVLVHTGSRALGAALAERHVARTLLEAGDIDGYLDALRAAIRYARANRWLVAWRLLGAAGLASDARVATVIDLVHNGVERCDGCYLHRKGAAPAAKDAPTVVLGSRGAPSHVMMGTGSVTGLSSVAHGAGRRMGRTEAYSKLKDRHTRASLVRTALGSRVIADDAMLMYEEHPDAYKPIAPVVESLCRDGLAHRVASLVPMVTVKR